MKIGRPGRLTALALAIVFSAVLVTGCGSGSTDLSVSSSADSAEAESSTSGETSTSDARSESAQQQLDQDVADGYLILVNKDEENHLAPTYEPSDLQQVEYVATDRSPAGWSMRKTAAEQFNLMSEAAAAEGIDVVVTTAYRSYEFQTQLFNSYVAQKGEAEANKTSARPGESEHQTGLAADLSTSEIDYANSSAFGDTQAGKWIAENCWKYGFIIRFPEGMDSITGYSYEPWHVRYVGKTAAKEIYDQNITLEEYVEENDLGNSIPADARASEESEDESFSAE
ncbi:MAG: M15 family metallopeptidase [Anaerovoracaceae bacterium]|jgi:D-alanyl-D-alanine carboxypeptidase